MQVPVNLNTNLKAFFLKSEPLHESGNGAFHLVFAEEA